MFLLKCLLFLFFLSGSALAWDPRCEHALNPLTRGEEATRSHPYYKRLVRLAKKLGVRIEWVDNVRSRVHEIDDGELVLPFSEELPFLFRKKIDFNPMAWFEDNTSPNLILLDRKKASLAALIHELRHAVQTGPENATSDGPFDRAVRKAKAGVRAFQEDVLQDATLSTREKKTLFDNANRFYETASEIAAYFGDYRIGSALGNKKEMADAQSNRREYRQRFLYSLEKLREHPFSRGYKFIEKFAVQVDAYFEHTGEVIAGLRTNR